ncbi:MAG: hypothetical protein V8S58_11820 [Lachnospiraceae bacterium]
MERGKRKSTGGKFLIPIQANLGCCDAAFKGGFTQSQELIDYWCERYGI